MEFFWVFRKKQLHFSLVVLTATCGFAYIEEKENDRGSQARILEDAVRLEVTRRRIKWRESRPYNDCALTNESGNVLASRKGRAVWCLEPHRVHRKERGFTDDLGRLATLSGDEGRASARTCIPHATFRLMAAGLPVSAIIVLSLDSTLSCRFLFAGGHRRRARSRGPDGSISRGSG